MIRQMACVLCVIAGVTYFLYFLIVVSVSNVAPLRRDFNVDTAKLTPEERASITNLVKSPGWYTLLHHHLLPHYQSASQTLDRLAGPASWQADVSRGIKHTIKSLLEDIYKVAQLPNPFEQHALALTANLASYTTPPAPVNTEHVEQEIDVQRDAPPGRRYTRTAHPV